VISDRGEIAMGDKRSTPDVEKLIDNILREIGFEVQDFSELESRPGHKQGPVVV